MPCASNKLTAIYSVCTQLILGFLGWTEAMSQKRIPCLSLSSVFHGPLPIHTCAALKKSEAI